jgi:capsular polysaccharide biosynthesis protein
VVGGWLEDGTVVEELQLYRGRKKPTPPARQTASAQIEEDRVYGGILIEHYGHFLFESLSRYWFLKKNPGLRPVWHIYPENAELTNWQKEIFSLLGVQVDPSDIIREPTKFKRLIVPQQGSELWTSIHPEQVEAMGFFPFRKPLAGRKLWLSRSLLGKGDVQREDILEDFLARAGWQIMHPEKIPVSAQLAQMADAEVIAGFDGSAFHTLMLGRDVRAKVVMIPRGVGTLVGPTYEVIAKAKGYSQFVVPARIIPVRRVGRHAIHRLEQPGELAEALNAV